VLKCLACNYTTAVLAKTNTYSADKLGVTRAAVLLFRPFFLSLLRPTTATNPGVCHPAVFVGTDVWLQNGRHEAGRRLRSLWNDDFQSSWVVDSRLHAYSVAYLTCAPQLHRLTTNRNDARSYIIITNLELNTIDSPMRMSKATRSNVHSPFTVRMCIVTKLIQTTDDRRTAHAIKRM